MADTAGHSLKRKAENEADFPVAELDRAGLSPWDRERPVRPIITDESHRTTLQVRSLNAELTCPVCLGILRHTMTVMDCLHRFCDGCITRALRLGRKECPTCRLKCKTKRNLRADPAVDGLVRRFYSDVEEFEKRQEEQIRSVNAALMKQSSEGRESAMRRQAVAAARLKPPSVGTAPAANNAAPPPPPPPGPAVRKQKPAPAAVTVAPKLPVLKAPAAAPSEPAAVLRHASVPYPLVPRPKAPAETGPTVAPDVALELRPADQTAAPLSHPFLRVPRAATLGTLAKLLASRLGSPAVEPSSVNFALAPSDPPLAHTRALGDLWTEATSEHLLLYSLSTR